MAHPSPSKLRSPRSRALEIGTAADGFEGDPAYDSQGGHPVTADTPARQYKEQAPTTTEGGAKPIQGNPIKLGGG